MGIGEALHEHLVLPTGNACAHIRGPSSIMVPNYLVQTSLTKERLGRQIEWIVGPGATIVLQSCPQILLVDPTRLRRLYLHS